MRSHNRNFGDRHPYRPNLNDGIVRGNDNTIELRDTALLRDSTKIQGQYELALKEVLLGMGAEAFYNGTGDVARFRISTTDTYPPDFFTTLFVKGKQVIIELHNADTKYFQRMGRFRELHGDRFYYILITSRLENPEEAYVQVGAKSEDEKNVDECWHMPRIYMHNKDTYDKKTYEMWKRMVKAQLEDFIDRRSDRCADWEAAAELINVRRVG